MIAVFGWIDIPAPSLTFAVWFLALGGMIALAILASSRPWALVLRLGDRIDPVLPVLLEAWQVRDVGYQWQGRYTLPLAVSIPVLAGVRGIRDDQNPALHPACPSLPYSSSR